MQQWGQAQEGGLMPKPRPRCKEDEGRDSSQGLLLALARRDRGLWQEMLVCLGDVIYALCFVRLSVHLPVYFRSSVLKLAPVPWPLLCKQISNGHSPSVLTQLMSCRR